MCFVPFPINSLSFQGVAWDLVIYTFLKHCGEELTAGRQHALTYIATSRIWNSFWSLKGNLGVVSSSAAQG